MEAQRELTDEQLEVALTRLRETRCGWTEAAKYARDQPRRYRRRLHDDPEERRFEDALAHMRRTGCDWNKAQQYAKAQQSN